MSAIIFENKICTFAFFEPEFCWLIIIINKNILLCIQLYPDEAHGLFGVTEHLHRTMEQFLAEMFGPQPDHWEQDYSLAAARLLEQECHRNINCKVF